MNRRHLLSGAAVLSALLLVAGCGSSSSTASSSSSAPAASNSPIPSSEASSTDSPAPASADRDASIAAIGRAAAAYSATVQTCMTDWASSLSDSDLQAATQATLAPEILQALSAKLASCARSEIIAKNVEALAAQGSSATVQTCVSDYMTGLSEEDFASLIAKDETTVASFTTAVDACNAAG